MAQGFVKAQTLQEVDKAGKRGLGTGRSSGSQFLQQIVSGAEGSRVVASRIQLVELEHAHRSSMETVSSVLESVRKRDFMFLINLEDAYFQILIHPGS